MLYVVIWGCGLPCDCLSSVMRRVSSKSLVGTLRRKTSLDRLSTLEIMFTAEDIVCYRGRNTTTFHQKTVHKAQHNSALRTGEPYSIHSNLHHTFHTLMSASPPLPLLLLFLHPVHCLLRMLNRELFAFCKQSARWATVVWLRASES